MKELTQEYLKQCLDYNPETGIFTWKERPREHFKNERDCKSWNTRFSAKQAGGLTIKGYIKIKFDKKIFMAHRIAWLYVHGDFPIKFIDHINGIKTDNRIENLRDADDVINQQNRTKAMVNSKSGVIGAMATPHGKYRVRIRVDGKRIHCGNYDTAEEANRVYIEMKRKVHPGCTI